MTGMAQITWYAFVTLFYLVLLVYIGSLIWPIK
jgi:hypothetical protein